MKNVHIQTAELQNGPETLLTSRTLQQSLEPKLVLLGATAQNGLNVPKSKTSMGKSESYPWLGYTIPNQRLGRVQLERKNFQPSSSQHTS